MSYLVDELRKRARERWAIQYEHDRWIDAAAAEIERLRAVLDGAVMAKTRLEDFADKANAGQIHYSARELKRKIGAAFAEFDAAYQQQPASPLSPSPKLEG